MPAGRDINFRGSLRSIKSLPENFVFRTKLMEEIIKHRKTKLDLSKVSELEEIAREELRLFISINRTYDIANTVTERLKLIDKIETKANQLSTQIDKRPDRIVALAQLLTLIKQANKDQMIVYYFSTMYNNLNGPSILRIKHEKFLFYVCKLLGDLEEEISAAKPVPRKLHSTLKKTLQLLSDSCIEIRKYLNNDSLRSKYKYRYIEELVTSLVMLWHYFSNGLRPNNVFHEKPNYVSETPYVGIRHQINLFSAWTSTLFSQLKSLEEWSNSEPHKFKFPSIDTIENVLDEIDLSKIEKTTPESL